MANLVKEYSVGFQASGGPALPTHQLSIQPRLPCSRTVAENGFTVSLQRSHLFLEIHEVDVVPCRQVATSSLEVSLLVAGGIV
jgi:hypothetical protein